MTERPESIRYDILDRWMRREESWLSESQTIDLVVELVVGNDEGKNREGPSSTGEPIREAGSDGNSFDSSWASLFYQWMLSGQRKNSTGYTGIR